jgi:hypothetical protein
MEAYSSLRGFTLDPHVKLILEPWRFTLEPRRLTLETHRLKMASRRLIP